MKVQKLPPEARRKLESGVVVTDLVQCVIELVHNSLDANASGIAVRVDLKNFCIKVIDNGNGIGKDDLDLVGERFMTSKYQPFDNCNSFCATYGYKGQALSSMLDFCRLLTIKTKTETDGPTLVKVFLKSKPSKITELQDKNFGTGTTIIIEDFMYTMPVRRKRIKEVLEMEEIKTHLQYLALLHYNVCFTLRNENKAVILLQTAQASSMLEMISNLYGKIIAKALKPVKYEENNFEVAGYTSVAPSKQNLQIIYINRQVITKGVIHKFINNVLKEYSGSKTLFSDSPPEQILKKLKNSHQTFIIQIKCPRDCYELFTNLRKTTVEFKNWKSILKCIHRGLKKAYKFDLVDDSVTHIDDGKEERKFGTSLLINAVKGVPVTRGFHGRNIRMQNNSQISEKEKLYENKENDVSKMSLIVAEGRSNECTVDTLETPIPKNRKTTRPLNFEKSNLDMSYIEFYNWLKTTLKTDANAFNLYSEFLQHKTNKTANGESFKSPVLDVKLKEKRNSPVKCKIPKKKPKPSDILTQEVSLATQKALKIFPNVDLRIKKAVQFNTEMRYIPELSNFDKRPDYNTFSKPGLLSKGQKQLELIQTYSSPAPSEIHFTNVIKFRNLCETEIASVEKELYSTKSWMSHYQEVDDNLQQLSNTSVKFLERNNKKVEHCDVIIQTSPKLPERVNVLVQTTQTVPESSFENTFHSDPNPENSEIPIPDFWNTSTPKSHFGSNILCDLNKKPKDVGQSDSSNFICGQKSPSNPRTNTDTQTFSHLWTDSLSEFGHVPESNGLLDEIPETIPLEEIYPPQFCLSERHDFVPKGLSPKFTAPEGAEIPNLNSQEKNRIHLTIDETKNELLNVKWQDGTTGKCSKPDFGEMQVNDEKKSVNFQGQILSASLSYCAIKVHNLLHSFTFIRESLSSFEVLGQLDEKFIVTKMKISVPRNMELISVLDQHAVDERIRLEEIINDYTTPETFGLTSLSHSDELTFSESEVQIIGELREKMLNYGFDVKPKSKDTILVNSVPSFLLYKFKKDNTKESSLKNYLQTVILSIVSEIIETRGAVSKIPKIIHDAFCSEACHGAIKFNRALSKKTMTEMIKKLKNCKLPFQCAHGRPSVIPIIDLEDFRFVEDEDFQINLEKIKKFCDVQSSKEVENQSN